MAFTTSQSQLKKDFGRITISLASPDTILGRSYGEVLKPETINYRSFRPEKDGLFCEKIFGPVRDWECHCGKYKRIRYKGIICDRCGVEVTQKAVRRERMGHITLAVPVVHIWYFRSLPNKIGYILGMSAKELERVIYYESYAVVNPGTSGLKKKELISEDDYFKILETLPENNDQLEDSDPNKFIALMGGEAIRELLARLDIEELAQELRRTARTETSIQKKADALKRLKVVEAFRDKGDGMINQPSWMVMSVVPVIPPELRPLVPLEGGRFATSDLNDLYRRVIIRNNRLKRLMDIRAPEVILRNEKRMLQEAVDSLFDNSRKVNAVRSDGNRALKSLSDMLKGKQGRFRQNLLGKRVDYSGRSVIVVGPELKLHECGLPKDMAVELFKPFVIRKLIERGVVKTVKSAKKAVDKKGAEVWDILEKVIDGHPVMLNRAPTLHRLGIQAFQPVLVEGKALRIHPLVCQAFNADFDGDQMAVHVPLSYDAQLEANLLMLSAHNVLSPANGNPITTPSQDMVLGMYYLTKQKTGDKGEGSQFATAEDAIVAYNSGAVGMHAKITVRIDDRGQTKRLETTVGRVIFNQIVPKEMGFLNELLTKKRMVQIIGDMYSQVGNLRTVEFLDAMKDMGFTTAMMGGCSVSLQDVIIPAQKTAIIDKARTKVDQFEQQYAMGFITDNERYNKVIDEWTHATNQVANVLFDNLKADRDGFNSIWMMVDSGARGSKEQIRQLAGMRGLMAKPQKSLAGQAGEIIENPIIANFREGLSVVEYFISTHGARKGLADTALKTADAGYLTRRLVDVSQDVIINEHDCGTIQGLKTGALKDGEEIVEPLSDRILGRTSLVDVYDPVTNELLVGANGMITEEIAEQIASSSIETVSIRSVLTCETKRGCCALCYGRNLANGKLVGMGECVGVIAAQSVGEPGTQLTLRTFHLGGTAGRIVAQSTVQTKYAGKVQFENVRTVIYNDGEEDQLTVIGRNGLVNILDENNRVATKYDVPYGAVLKVQDGQMVSRLETVFEWDPFNAVILADVKGRVRYVDIRDGVTSREEPDEQTGHIQRVIIESRDRTLSPTIIIEDEDGVRKGSYIIPTRANLNVNDGDMVQAGHVLVKIPRETGKTRDITGGLPRVTELFEARNPVDPAVVSEIDGTVSFGAIKRGAREVLITARDGSDQKKYLVPFGKHILVQENDFVYSGEQLSDGAIAPHDILRIKGPAAVQAYLVNEIQEVYRLQGVKINDKHVEVIVRQMMQKVIVVDPGDTGFLENDQVDRGRLAAENTRVAERFVITDPGDSKLREGQIVSRRKLRDINSDLKRRELTQMAVREALPATSEPLLLGITQAALTTDSFISAASFQETTKVLTDAAIEGKSDYLMGLKENVIVGHLIPAGTGIRKFNDVMVMTTDEAAEEASRQAAIKAAERYNASELIGETTGGGGMYSAVRPESVPGSDEANALAS